MTRLQSDIMNSTSTRPGRQLPMMPFRDRRDRVVGYVTMLAMVTVNSIVIGSASWVGWPFWAWLATCLPAFFVFVAGYSLWYHRRSPVTTASETS